MDDHEPGAELVNDFYFTREEAEAALEEARRDSSHPEDVAALACQQVERIVLDDPTPSEN